MPGGASADRMGSASIYDRVCSALVRSGETDALAKQLRAIHDLASHYRSAGLPRIRDLGRTSYEAAAAGGLLPHLAALVP